MRDLARRFFRKPCLAHLPSPSLSVHSLEDRAVPAFTPFLSGAAVTFTGSAGNDALTLYLEHSFGADQGKLTHNHNGQSGYFNQNDLNTSLAVE